jgi:hypothetical protein
MKATLVNVRLDEARLRKARALRNSGLRLSDVVRQAIDERFEGLSERGRPHDVRAIIARIFERYPDPPNLPPRTYDVHDGREARRVTRRKLRRRRR